MSNVTKLFSNFHHPLYKISKSPVLTFMISKVQLLVKLEHSWSSILYPITASVPLYSISYHSIAKLAPNPSTSVSQVRVRARATRYHYYTAGILIQRF